MYPLESPQFNKVLERFGSFEIHGVVTHPSLEAAATDFLDRVRREQSDGPETTLLVRNGDERWTVIRIESSGMDIRLMGWDGPEQAMNSTGLWWCWDNPSESFVLFDQNGDYNEERSVRELIEFIVTAEGTDKAGGK